MDNHLLEPTIARQHGVFLRSQARQAGFDRHAIERRLRSGTWVALSEQVVALAGAPPSHHRALFAGVLDAGPSAVLSFSTLAALYEVPGYQFEPVHVLLPHESIDRRWTPTLCVVHSSTRIPAHHVIELDGLPVVNPTRLAFDISSKLHPQRLARLVDTCGRAD